MKLKPVPFCVKVKVRKLLDFTLRSLRALREISFDFLCIFASLREICLFLIRVIRVHPRLNIRFHSRLSGANSFFFAP
jgi:hypothetical protein